MTVSSGDIPGTQLSVVSAQDQAGETPALPAVTTQNYAALGRLWQRILDVDQHTAIAGLGFLCLFAANFMAPTDPDYWWHLRTGQLIAETGAVPTHDVFSYTAFGRPWVTQEWLAELAMYWLNAVGGYATVVAAFSLAVTGAYFVLYRLIRGLEVDRTLALALVVWTALIRWAQWAPRPQLITFLFFAVTLYLLFTFKQRGRARLWLLPPMMVLWVNVHAGYVSGLLLIALFAAGEGLNRLTHRPAAPLRPLLLTGLASVVAALANPNFFRALLYPLTYVGTSNASMRFIAEWQSVDFHNYLYLPFALAMVLLMLTGSRGRLDFTQTLLVLVFTLMALQSVRHIILFAMATTPVLALRLKERNVRLALEVGTGRRTTPLLTLAPLVLVPILLAVVLIKSPQSQARPTPSTADFPADGVVYLKEHHPAGNLFNTYGWGGYLIYTLYPEYRVFIDGRADVYGDALMGEYAKVANITPRWREVLDKYQVGTAMVEKDSPIAVLLASQNDWRQVYEGKVERIFVRREAP
ncbi:MAG: hypothetical protein M0Z94_15820 [Dehalococcoidales bacterium]|nr:hypothetical protein [Dehalococcoidales bacterium]